MNCALIPPSHVSVGKSKLVPLVMISSTAWLMTSTSLMLGKRTILSI